LSEGIWGVGAGGGPLLRKASKRALNAELASPGVCSLINITALHSSAFKNQEKFKGQFSFDMLLLICTIITVSDNTQVFLRGCFSRDIHQCGSQTPVV
jgi:hypothetical protein